MNQKRLLWAAMTLLCLYFPVKVNAQNRSNQTLRDTLTLELGGKNRLVIPVKSVRQPDQLPGINALVRRLNQDLRKVGDTMVNAKYTTTVLYQETSGGGRTLKVNAKTDERSVLYVMKESGLIKTKLNADSVIVELPEKRKLFFILDSLAVLRQLENRDIDGLLTQLQEEISEELARRSKRNLIAYNGPYMATYTSEQDGTRKLKLNSRPGDTDQLAIFGNTGVGLVRDKLVPEIGLGVGIFTRRHTYFGITSSMHYFFDRREDGKYGMAINTFVTLEVAQGVGRTAKLWQKIGVGYLVSRQGDYFGKNTFKLSLSLTTKPRHGSLHLIPELIITDNFKTAFPGIRIGVGF